MIEIFPNLFIGDENDCVQDAVDKFSIVHACKDPCYEKFITDNNMEKPQVDKSGYLYLPIEVKEDLYLNIIDRPNPRFYTPLFDVALDFIYKKIKENKRVLVHCNKGLSRSPTLAIAYVCKFRGVDIKRWPDVLLKKIDYNPSPGMFEFLDMYLRY
ncbi:MAG: dual specificity protein phosphatase [Candidatus Omnitrophica bacterium]|nr:dual specificity protein phosphatase [Candidatus Omnitrophota bacterium]